MSTPPLDRRRLKLHSLAERRNRVAIERDVVRPDADLSPAGGRIEPVVAELADDICRARAAGRPVILAFGAHTVKNGLGLVLQELIAGNHVTHLATNGAGIIHDWEFAFQGQSSEDVRQNVATGRFGLWEETGFHLNLALLLGAVDGLGYGASVGRLIERECHDIPAAEALRECTLNTCDPVLLDRAAAAADLLRSIETGGLTPGAIRTPHPFKQYSIQAAAYRMGIPFTAHPMFGHDIIYTHPLNCGAAIGRTAERDFLAFAGQIASLQGGIYISVGSAVMSPMIFEKSFSMAQNLALQSGGPIDDHRIVVVDLADNNWDWSTGEPPESAPEYYMRYCKTFARMGGTLDYISADNRDFLLLLLRALRGSGKQSPSS